MADIIFTVLALHMANQLRPMHWIPFESLASHVVPVWLFPIVCLIWVTVFSYQGVYDKLNLKDLSAQVYTITKSIFVSTLLLAGALYLSYRELSRGYFIIFVALNFSFLLGWRIIAGKIVSITSTWTWLGGTVNSARRRRVLIVGDNSTGAEISSELLTRERDSIDIVGVVDDQSAESNVIGSLSDVRSLVCRHEIHDVIIALKIDEHEKIRPLVLALEDLPVTVRVIPEYLSLSMYKARAEEFGGVVLLNLRAPAITSAQRLTKRLFDLVLSTVLIILLSPVFLVIAILIKLDSTGPVLFIQERVGENGKKFEMIKFRSMIHNAEIFQSTVNQLDKRGNVLHKQKNDTRVTTLGRFIRSTSIDELPQLFNVVAGNMSLVGPRPEMPWLVEQYTKAQRRRFSVPQGMTGWWQINGRSDKPMHLHTDDDVYYIRNYSFWLDLFILIKTPMVVLKGKGAF